MAQQNKAPTLEDARNTHHEPIIRNPSKYEPEMGRFANTTQMVFHPTPEHPLDPNAGILTYLPGASFPLHKHDFAQVWYVIEGELTFGTKELAAGDMVYMKDPHFEYDMKTEKGCKILFVQYPGPTTRGVPIYQGRFNRTERRAIEQEDLER
jgi:mannose-6-phosphate isomerase-like protein (cupin superfamily)